MTDEPRICITCKHYGGPPNDYVAQMNRVNEEPLCGNPRSHSRDLVNGKCMCRIERNDKKGCGPTGKLWESVKTEKSA